MPCTVVGHRGFKAKYTENTLHGFEKCLQSGALAIETDLWTTRDNVLVVSHDVSTARIFCSEDGNDTAFNILETDFKDLRSLSTIKSGEPLLTFKQLLRWFRRFAGSEPYTQCKIMLDIKNANPPALLRLLVEDVMAVGPELSWWYPRLQLGIWNLRFLKYLNQDEFFQRLDDGQGGEGRQFFDIFHISLSWEDTMTYLSYAEYIAEQRPGQKTFVISGVSLIYVSTWSSECLEKFLPLVKERNLTLINWTINTPWQLSYFIEICRYHGLSRYGVIADDPQEMMKYVADEETRMDAAREPCIPWKFSVVNWLIRAGTRLGPKSPLTSSSLFESRVDASERLASRPTMANKVFAFLQAMGIF